MNSVTISSQDIERSMDINQSRVERTFTVATLIAGLDLGMFVYVRSINRFFAILFGGLVISVILYLFYSNRVITKITAYSSRIILKYPFDMEKSSQSEFIEKIIMMQKSTNYYISEINKLQNVISLSMRNINRFFNFILITNLVLFFIIFLFV